MSTPPPPVKPDPDPIAVVTLALTCLTILAGAVLAIDQRSMAVWALCACAAAAVFVIGCAASILAKRKR